MNVLMVSHTFSPFFSGAAKQATFLAAELKKMGIYIEFITNNYQKKSHYDDFNGIKVFRCSTFFFINRKINELIFAIRLLIYVLNNNKFEIIHFHSMTLESLIFPFLKILHKKIILKLTLIGVDDPMTFKKRRKIGFIYAWTLKFVDQFVAISSQLQHLTLKSGIPRDYIRVIYNGVNTERFIKVSDRAKIELKNKLAKNFKTVLLSIGQVEYRKGYDFLLKAWVDIRKAFESPVLLIAGPNNEDANPYYLLLKEFMKKNNLHDVVFLGEIDNAEEYMKIADCFVFCSRAEGFGTVLIEAMSASVPVVATNIPGVTEDIIQDEAIGRICYSDSPQEFARLAIDLLKNQNSEKLGESASRVRARFDISLIAQQYHEMYSQLLNHPL